MFSSNQSGEADNFGAFDTVQSAAPMNMEKAQTFLQKSNTIAEKSADHSENVKPAEEKSKSQINVICKVCKRKFPTQESLINHEKYSDLHRENLEKLGK